MRVTATVGLVFGVLVWNEVVVATPDPLATVREPAQLVNGFIAALEVASGEAVIAKNRSESLWVERINDIGIEADWLAARLAKAKKKSADPFAAYREIEVEVFAEERAELQAEPVALHAYRLDVLEDYDDASNDDVYAYYITTHDDMLWGRVTDVYSNLDEGDSAFFSVADRSVFGPHGQKLRPRHHTIVDFGLVESDAEDIAQLQRLTDAVIDLATVALSATDATAGASAARARAETQNLLRLIIEMDEDDRLVTDTLRFTPASMMEALGTSSTMEFRRRYGRSTPWTHFDYRVHWRMIR
jgi:hypothetical protein